MRVEQTSGRRFARSPRYESELRFAVATHETPQGNLGGFVRSVPISWSLKALFLDRHRAAGCPGICGGKCPGKLRCPTPSSACSACLAAGGRVDGRGQAGGPGRPGSCGPAQTALWRLTCRRAAGRRGACPAAIPWLGTAPGSGRRTSPVCRGHRGCRAKAIADPYRRQETDHP